MKSIMALLGALVQMAFVVTIPQESAWGLLTAPLMAGTFGCMAYLIINFVMGFEKERA